MDKRFWLVLVGIAVVLGGIFFFTNSEGANAPSDGAKGTLTNHTTGSGTTGVKLVEYGDFQCPACGQFEPAVEQVRAKYGDQITFQFRNFPLFQIHNNAIAGARAAEAADMQDKYWEMHDMLYQYQNEWSTISDPLTAFKGYAKTLGLKEDKFLQDYKSTTVNDRVQADLKEGEKLGVNSTPTFFLDGKKISNPDPTLEAFSKVIDAEIAKKSKATPTPSPSPEPSPEVTPAPAE